ncbi:MAG: CDP-alcohol phosphatidyltransferase family protein [Candidatus Methylomirabilales bacterium]
MVQGPRAALQPAVDALPRLAGRVAWRAPEDGDLPALALVLSPLVVLEAGALRAWVAGAGPAKTVIAPEESEAGPLIARAPALLAAVRALRRGLNAAAAFLREAWDEGHVSFRRWGGPEPAWLRSPGAIPAVERALLRALRTPEDGPIVDTHVNRRASAWITRGLVRLPVTPNQVTLASLGTGLVAAWLLGQRGWAASLGGLALFQLSVILDHSDGEIARLKFQFSRLGKWLDNWSDHAVDLAVVGFLAWRVVGGGSGRGAVLLAVLAALGITGSFLAVFFWSLGGPPRPGAAADPLLAMANRDGFCLALWGSVLIGRPELLLWLLAVGANLYWIVWVLTRRLRAHLTGC